MTPLTRVERRLLLFWIVLAVVVWNGVYDVRFEYGLRGYLIETALAAAYHSTAPAMYETLHRSVLEAVAVSTFWALLVLLGGLVTIRRLTRPTAWWPWPRSH